ncbi:MAG TPA: hypothetical protein VF669_14195 [Tepidisphaeraceae bacterium]
MALSYKLNLFTQHSRAWQTNRYVYPVISRRSRGLSIGVNLNPDKICNFDCIYCCVDRREPVAAEARDVDLEVLKRELDHLVALAATGEIWNQPPFDHTPANLRRLNDIAFSGDGEPTSFKHFYESCAIAAGAIDKHNVPQTKIVLITNATLLERPRVQQALAFIDAHNGEIWAKLDAGTDAYYRLVERTSIPLSRVLANIRDAGRLRPLVIQSLFMKINNEPPADEEINQYINRLDELKRAGCQIKLVQVYTVARQTAESYVKPLDDAQVDAIAEKVRALNLPAESHYGPT